MLLIKQKSAAKKPTLRNNSLNTTIRSSQPISTRLRLFRPRLHQVWQWRRNRKSSQAWRSLRFLNPYNLTRFYKGRRRTDFRFNRIVKNYINWRLNSKVNFKKINLCAKTQNYQQNLSVASNSWFNTNVGNALLFYSIIRNRSLLMDKYYNFKINGHQQLNSVLDRDILLYQEDKNNHNSHKLALETSQLLGVLQQFNLLKKQQYYKYYPKLQRNLNSWYTLNK